MKIYVISLVIFSLSTSILPNVFAQEQRGRIRDFGISIGILPTGQHNAITDVSGVKVGHTTLIQGADIRTGVTAILPYTGNIFQEKVPAAVYVGNGFGKMLGISQIEELGNIETPILLTNTLNAPIVANALIDYMLSLPGNEDVRSVNSVVGETNDGGLNDIRGRHIQASHVIEAIHTAAAGPIAEGNVGAGTGTECLGFKGGIGTASRKLPSSKGGYTVGVLVQSNFGGVLAVNGAPIGRELRNFYMKDPKDTYKADGSCMIVIATDAPLSSRNLKRLAKRSYIAFGNVGAFSSNGSGDYSIAFSTHPDVRIPHNSKDMELTTIDINNNDMSALFMAVWEATEEAILNSMFMAEDMKGRDGRELKAIPIQQTLKIMKKYNSLQHDKLPRAIEK
ncbi:DmpA family aminopeptidase [Sphingobacterium wenxiniae]|uniref:L-aminopeptidase DmpA. Serine peptidase. MEROPS family S58 n=1 Tax=Sphingobacterium wenxiniae TaxID=683125 RepID=A0A1I6RX94_9SPHI|nr:P1 family peptidase [Sphingobacterium wenxiniae]SFS69319.1 L-aminopeptidase DmpA. Serine peptidase. MEROPS family S58 [Sphingobacterium wenxiniae]